MSYWLQRTWPENFSYANHLVLSTAYINVLNNSKWKEYSEWTGNCNRGLLVSTYPNVSTDYIPNFRRPDPRIRLPARGLRVPSSFTKVDGRSGGHGRKHATFHLLLRTTAVWGAVTDLQNVELLTTCTGAVTTDFTGPALVDEAVCVDTYQDQNKSHY